MKYIKRKSAVKPITGSIVDTINIDDKTTNTYSARVIEEELIKTITNENGTAIKFPDGTMICKHKIIGASHPNQTLRDNSYFYAQGKYSSDSPENMKDWTFPEEFATTDDLVVSIIVSSSAYTMTSMSFLETTGTRGLCVTPYPVDSVFFVWNFIAIGRWK